MQAIDTEALLALAERENGVLHLAYPPGEFVTLGNVLAMWRPASSEPDKNAAIREAITSQMEKRINSAFTLGKQRTATQDAGFLLLQLVEIATRALSPGINDPFTALLCLDRLGAALCHLATQEFPSVQHCDAKGAVRLVVQSPDFEALVYLTFTSIRCYGSSDPLVAARLLRVIGEVASHTSNGRRRDLLRNHLLWAYAAARTEAKSEAVQAVLENTYKNILHRFDTQIDTLSRKE